jgi:hypothetical protein
MRDLNMRSAAADGIDAANTDLRGSKQGPGGDVRHTTDELGEDPKED